MDVGLPRRDQDLPDPLKNPYALWVRDTLEVAYDQVCRNSSQKCKLDSPWMGPYLVVSLVGWAVGIQLQPDSPILIVHCQGLKKIPHPSGFVPWTDIALPEVSPAPPLLGASTVCHQYGGDRTLLSAGAGVHVEQSGGISS